jgi:hypothetical protein
LIFAHNAHSQIGNQSENIEHLMSFAAARVNTIDSGEQRLGGYCQWVLDAVCQTVEWLFSH